MLELRLAYSLLYLFSHHLKKIGITWDSFNSSGNTPFSNEKLIRRVRGFTKYWINDLPILAEYNLERHYYFKGLHNYSYFFFTDMRYEYNVN